MSLLRCLFRVGEVGHVGAKWEPPVYIVDEQTVSEVRRDWRAHIGWASPPRNDYEKTQLEKHPGCVWVTTKIAPIQVVGIDAD